MGLLSAAADIFVEKGFHETKISDIVTRAGVAQGTFYLYFKNKSDILVTLLNDCCGDIIYMLNEFSQDRKSVNSVGEFKKHNLNFLTNLLMMLESKHNAIKLILASPVGERSEVNEILTKLKNSLIDITKQNLDEGIEAGYIRQLDSRIISEAIVGMIYSVAFNRLVYKKNTDINVQKLVLEIIDFEMQGIANKQGKGEKND